MEKIFSCHLLLDFGAEIEIRMKDFHKKIKTESEGCRKVTFKFLYFQAQMIMCSKLRPFSIANPFVFYLSVFMLLPKALVP